MARGLLELVATMSSVVAPPRECAVAGDRRSDEAALRPADAARAPECAVVTPTLRLAIAALCVGLVALPLLAVRIPPITDLPQHVAQMRLLNDALHNPNTIYTVQWFTPYSLVYGIIAVAWALFPPLEVGRMTVLALAVLWTAAVHLVAARRGRSPVAATLASVFFFNVFIYWGFLNFAVGFLSFTLWFLLTTRAPRDAFRARDAVAYLAVATLLYVSHVLWLVFAVGWLFLVSLVHRVPLRTAALRFASIVPVLVVVAVWYPLLAENGFVSRTTWFVPILKRFSFFWLADGALGGLRGWSEPIVLGVVLAWCAVSLWEHRRKLGEVIDADLAWLAAACFGLALVLPDQHMSTIGFSVRWLAPAMIAFVLALPAPRLGARWQSLLSVSLVAVFCLSTTLAWMRFERDELSGLDASLAALPASTRVLGLDFVKVSSVIKGRPFLQTFAYAQVVRGSWLNFSFAAFAPSLVLYREPLGIGWTSGLEWSAEKVRASDFRYFDYALVNAAEEVHEVLARRAPVVPVTTHGRWRLYQSTAKWP
jgi:hypothetical protein